MGDLIKSSYSGKKSSKRFFGIISLSIGIALLVVGAFASMKVTFQDPELFKFCAQTLMITGASLLGIGVLDGIGNKLGGPK